MNGESGCGCMSRSTTPKTRTQILPMIPRCSSPVSGHSAGKHAGRDPLIVPAAGLNEPKVLDAALADGHATAMEIHRGAAMGGDHFQVVADVDGGVVRVHAGVFLGELGHPVLRPAFDDRGAEVA